MNSAKGWFGWDTDFPLDSPGDAFILDEMF